MHTLTGYLDTVQHPQEHDMAKTLKNTYERKALSSLQERIRKIDAQVMSEARFADVLVERMEQGDLDKVSQIIDKLESIKNPKLPVLTKAIEQGQADVNKYTAGGPLANAWSKLQGLAGIDNPIVKITTFADALERGFQQLPTIIKNNLGSMKDVDTSKSLTQLMTPQPQAQQNVTTQTSTTTSKHTEEPASEQEPTKYRVGSQNEADSDVQSAGKLKVVASQMLKALAPGGVFGAFKKVPYVDTKALVQELLTAPISALAPAVKGMRAGVKAAEIAPDMQDTITNKPGEGTKGSTLAQPGQQQSNSRPTSPSSGAKAASGSTGTEQNPTRSMGTSAQRAYSDLKDAGVDKEHGVSPAALKAIVAALEEKGYIK